MFKPVDALVEAPVVAPVDAQTPAPFCPPFSSTCATPQPGQPPGQQFMQKPGRQPGQQPRQQAGQQPGRRHALLALAAGAGTAALGAGLAGCTLLRQPDPVPMRQMYDDRACPATQAPVLLVLLPGLYMALEELQQQGFVSALRQRGIAADVLLVDANIGYVRDGSLRRRLHEEVLAPARSWGYRRIWLAGISLGGFVALAYAMQQPGEVEGVMALAPYLGRDALLQQLAAAGGAAAWAAQPGQAAQPPASAQPAQPAPPAEDDIEARLWRWLARPPAGAPQLWLGYGSDDRLAQGHRLLAPLLPAGHVLTVPGGHTWAPWRTLWAQWLDQRVLPAQCVA